MKKKMMALLLAGLCVSAAACAAQNATIGGDQQPGTTTLPVTVPTTMTQPTTVPVRTGWEEADGNRYYYLEGEMLLGWQQIEDAMYYLGQDGVMRTGWQQIEDTLYYLGEDGAMCTGWQQIGDATYYMAQDGAVLTGWQSVDGLNRYFLDNGTLATGWQSVDGLNRYFLDDGTLAAGWQQIDGNSYYLDSQGCALTGWTDINNQRYYLGNDGIMHTGWLELGGVKYYLKDNGVMARGCVVINGVKNYFTSTGAYIVLANPWNYIPADYDPELVVLSKYANYSNMYVDRECYEAMIQMLDDCARQAAYAVVVSSYRTHDFQTKNYERKVQYYLNLGYDRAEAEVLAAKVVAVPGTSEHQLGLALDIVDASYPYLDNAQANTTAQKWLMANSWKYGFILRYPADKTDVTGIIYEPWHYRYVGKELAAELYELGLTLEEYLQQITE